MFAGLKKLIGIVVLATAAVRPSEASTVRLVWNPSTSADVVEYRVYVGTIPGQYTNSFSAGNSTSFVVPNLSSGTTYHFAVSAVNTADLESLLSSPVSGQAPSETLRLTGNVVSGAEYELRVQGPASATYVFDQSDDLGQWSAVATRQADANGLAIYRAGRRGVPKRFFRVRVQ